jgi:hypothetical protein
MIGVKINLDGDNCWPDLQEKIEQGKLIEVKGLEVAMLLGGMSSGKPSVAFRFDLEDGRVVFTQTSLELLESAARSMRIRYEQSLRGKADA